MTINLYVLATAALAATDNDPDRAEAHMLEQFKKNPRLLTELIAQVVRDAAPRAVPPPPEPEPRIIARITTPPIRVEPARPRRAAARSHITPAAMQTAGASIFNMKIEDGILLGDAVRSDLERFAKRCAQESEVAYRNGQFALEICSRLPRDGSTRVRDCWSAAEINQIARKRKFA